ncbi:MAG: superoxide dismutase [Defluviitaleaceae bacterium]|nr:superoxide dismutase [Defluviitaleaceae bacterium]
MKNKITTLAALMTLRELKGNSTLGKASRKLYAKDNNNFDNNRNSSYSPNPSLPNMPERIPNLNPNSPLIPMQNLNGENHYPFKLLPLPYLANSLEPYIDTTTMEIHHGKHVLEYVQNLNAALKDYPEYHSWSLEKLLYNVSKLPKDIQTPVINNGGGVFNHNLYFNILTKGGKSLKQGSPLSMAIDSKFGSLNNLKAELKAAGLAQFGSGWSWLVSNKNGDLSVMRTANQNTLIEKNLTPVLNIDVWEHAYYLLYQNLRKDYIDSFFKVLNWESAERNYAKYKEIDYSKL